jgi:hypothetical protein
MRDYLQQASVLHAADFDFAPLPDRTPVSATAESRRRAVDA